MSENLQFFEQMHSKFAKSRNMAPEFVFLNNTSVGYQKRRIFMLIPNFLKWTKNVSEKI
jgi:hypothetical protein